MRTTSARRIRTSSANMGHLPRWISGGTGAGIQRPLRCDSRQACQSIGSLSASLRSASSKRSTTSAKFRHGQRVRRHCAVEAEGLRGVADLLTQIFGKSLIGFAADVPSFECLEIIMDSTGPD